MILGQNRLSGRVKISGAKNASLPILAATLLTDERCIIRNVPNLGDVRTMLKLLKALGINCNFSNNEVTVQASKRRLFTAPYNLVSTMRASICVLGPLIARLSKAIVSFPGGCVIGPRPIDLHLKGISALGAKIRLQKGYIVATANRLKGTKVYLGGHFGSSVLATANTMMAATLARGKTVIENAACEPEIVDLAEFLTKMGARIKGYGTPRIEIDGVRKLNGAVHTVIPDRIEAGTFMIATAITKGDVVLEGVISDHLSAVVDKLKEVGVSVIEKDNTIRVYRKNELRPVDVTTLPYPGFPTDLQAQLMSLMSVVDGISVITEKVFPRRFIHISELNRMGAVVHLEGPSAIVKGVTCLNGAPVMASDLRASAGLILAGLVAKGKTEVSRVYHLDRGYEELEVKLSNLGADIKRVKET